MKSAPRLRTCLACAAALAALASSASARLPAQSILLEPGSVNASISGDAWWLANNSVTVTWSIAGGRFRLASIYDRVGGRPAPRTGEAFTIVFADGRVVKGSEMRAVGRPLVESLPPGAGSPGEREPGKRIVARFESADGGLRVTWRGSLRDGAHYVRQELTFDSTGAGPAPKQVVLVDAEDAGARLAASSPAAPALGRGSFMAVEHARARCDVQDTQVRCSLPAAAWADTGTPPAMSAVIGLATPASLEAAVAGRVEGPALLDSLLKIGTPEAGTRPPDVGFAAGPYLQAPGPTSMTVMWATDRASAGWVEYGPDEGTLSRTAMPASDGLVDANTTLHRVTIGNLAPDTVYHYRVAARPIQAFGPYKVDFGGITRSAAATFRTLGPARDRYSFLVMNDLHEDVATMRRHAGRAAAEPYDLVFLNGDSLSHLESDTQILERCLAPAGELFARQVPLLLVRGNHETRGRYARLLKDYLGLPGNRYYYSFDHGPVHFVVMDTGEDKEDGHWAYSGLTRFDEYRQAQAEWLASEVRSPAFRNAAFRILVAHMPFYGNQGTRVDGYGQRDARDRWGALLNDAGLDLHIAGHTHRANWVDATPGANRFPVAVGGGSQQGTNTLTRVRVSPERLEVIVATDDGREVGRHSVPRRPPAAR